MSDSKTNKDSHFVRFPFFDMGDFIMRELKTADAPLYLEYMTKPEVAEYVPDYMVPYDLEKANIEIRYWMNLFLQKRGFFWGIAKKNNDKLFGTIGFNFINFFNKKGEINYDLAYESWGRGVMKKCLNKVLEFSKSVGLVRVQATTVVDNLRSIKLLESCGFNREGTMKNYESLRGKYHDSFMYSKISI